MRATRFFDLSPHPRAHSDSVESECDSNTLFYRIFLTRSIIHFARKCSIGEFAQIGLAANATRMVLIGGVIGIAALSIAGCAQQPQLQRTAHSKEYFPSSLYGRASPRVVADGEPVPRGGGMYLVGKPYSVAGQTYYPSEKDYSRVGLASWYGEAFHGRRTANGEVYDREAISAAHPTMPLPSYARITNLHNNYSMIVRVNDRGPFHANRIMDVSQRTAETLDFHGSGTARVKVEYIGRASLAGSDDSKLLATLRVHEPANLDRRDGQANMMVASASALPTASIETPRSEALAGATSVQSQPKDASSRVPVPPPSIRPIASHVPLPPARPFDLATKPASVAATKVARIGLR